MLTLLSTAYMHQDSRCMYVVGTLGVRDIFGMFITSVAT